MSIISIATIFLIGWLIYRVFHPQNLEISPISLALMWLLGTGGIYIIYYVCVGFFQQNPSPLLILLLGIIGLIEAFRIRKSITLVGWQFFIDAKLSTAILTLIIVMMSISIFMSGFYADTTRMWMAKGDMLNQLPDYINLMDVLANIRHADYPMVMSHQYQWQLVWASDWISLKLSTWVWYITLLLSATALFTRYTKHPIRWLILLAGYPAYWFILPLATVDIPLSVMLLVVISLLLHDLDRSLNSRFVIAFICGMIVLTKNEGFLIVGSVICGLIITLFIHADKRQQLLKLLGLILLVSGLSFASWYILIVPQANISVGSDFGLSGFRPERIPQVLEIIVPILLNPLQTAGLWLIFIGFIIFGYRQEPILWLPTLLYLLIISLSYTFSVRQTTLLEHVVQSYFRLLLQIMPVALVYVARCFSMSEISPKQSDGPISLIHE